MNLLSRVLKSLHDGSFAVKVLNRLSNIKYEPAPSVAIDEYIAKHYQGEGWKTLSEKAKKAWVQFSPIFKKYEIQTIAYVGANIGTTALALDEAFPGCSFYLIEPVPQVFEELVKNTSQKQNMHCVNTAASAKKDRQNMFVDNYSPASSCLPYESIALQEYPFLGKQVAIEVQMQPLDDILRDYKAGEVDLLLMDVQGYEDEVLKGACQTLKTCKIVISELSLQSLYVGSSTFDSVYQTLVREGFQLRYLINPMEGASQQILQIDGIFVREKYKKIR